MTVTTIQDPQGRLRGPSPATETGTTTGTTTGHGAPPRPLDRRGEDPEHEVNWTDPVTGAHGWLIVHTLVGGLATGGTRMRVGCTRDEVAALARGMANKTSAFALPVGGAKGGIDFDPRDERADDVLERFCSAMRPWLDHSWVTAEDLGVSQEKLDRVFARLGLEQSYHAAIHRSPNPTATLERVRAGLTAETDDGLQVGEVIGGYGVAQACLGVASGRGWDPGRTTVAIQGIGTMGGGAAFYLHEAGVRVVAIADTAGTLVDPDGLDVPALLDLRDEYGEIDRSGVPGHVEQRDRDAIVEARVDILVPAAISRAIREDNVDRVVAQVVVEAANNPTTAEAEDALTARGIPVVPDVIANTGAAAWAWWLLQGQVGTDPEDSFRRLREGMQSKVVALMTEWDLDRVPPRRTAWDIADENRRVLQGIEIAIP